MKYPAVNKRRSKAVHKLWKTPEWRQKVLAAQKKLGLRNYPS